jgi:hypothetical protein
MTITAADLEAFVGQSIGQICTNGFAAASQNHCAHFVSHALGIKLGMLCGDMAFKTRHTGASIRCDVGIHFGGKVYNFSNGQHKVIADPTAQAFHSKFKSVYAGDDVSLFYGVAP